MSFSRLRLLQPFLRLRGNHVCRKYPDLVLRPQPWISNYRYSTSAASPPDSPPQSPPKLHMVFTCTKCNTRSVKSFSKRAYEQGVVLVRCPGCQAQHVIADNLGWFGEEKNIEEILAKKSQQVTTITDVDLDIHPKGSEH